MRFVSLLITVLAALVLTGCGGVSRMIPDQVVTNPLAVHQKLFTLSLDGAVLERQSLAPLSARGSLEATVPNVESFIGLPVTPRAYAVELGFGPFVTVAAGSALPERFTLRGVRVRVTLEDGVDGAGGARALEYVLDVPADLELRALAECATFCSYTWEDADAAASLLSTEVTGPALLDATRILTGGEFENRVRVTVEFRTDLPAEVGQAQVVTRLLSASGVLRF